MVQNSFRISTDVDSERDETGVLVQNSFRISTDVDQDEVVDGLVVQNSFRISTDVDSVNCTRSWKSKTHFEFLLM